MFEVLKNANDHGIWDMISVLVLIPSFFLAIYLLFLPRRRVPNLNFHITSTRDDSNYPLRINIEIRNLTGRAVVISHPSFKFAGILRGHPQAHRHTETGEYEIKFAGQQPQQLTEIECLLRHTENTQTWVPVDPEHTDEQVNQAIQSMRAGMLICTCTWFQEKPKSHKLKTKL